MLVLTAEFAELAERGGAGFANARIELALLGGMIVALVVAIVLLRKRSVQAVADRA